MSSPLRQSTPGSTGRHSEQPPGPSGVASSRNRMLIAVAAVAVLAIGLLLVAVVAGGKDDKKAATGQSSNAEAAGPAKSVSAPLAGRQESVLELTSGAEQVTIRATDLGDELYRISTPGDGALAPKASDTGTAVQVTLETTGKAGSASAEVILNQKVKWGLKLVGGGMRETIDFKSGRLSSVELGAGAGDIDISVPKAEGELVIRMSGGAGQLAMHAPAGPPTQVKLGQGAGAGTVTVDGKATNGVAPGTTLTPDGWDKATDRYVLDAAVGASTLTVDRY